MWRLRHSADRPDLTLDALTMAATIPMALEGAAVSARVGGDHLCSFFDGQDFKTQPISNDHDHLMLLELYLAGLKLQQLMMETGRAETHWMFYQHDSGT
ncbi:hypothetical protein [Prochlorococcus marinus]|uniref:hypothetical protein n=1 Tax=Prochlorococcus TaxID=1218 RepID=UPI0007B320D3|nr:hypothetical protein [Prochlorococcus marinus]